MSSNIERLTENPGLRNTRDFVACPHCGFRLLGYAANYTPPPKQDFNKRLYIFLCPECKKIIEYPFCPYEEAFPEKAPHATSCASILGCVNSFHDLCLADCYESNIKLDTIGYLQFPGYCNQMIRDLVFRYKYDDQNRLIARYKLLSMEDCKKC